MNCCDSSITEADPRLEYALRLLVQVAHGEMNRMDVREWLENKYPQLLDEKDQTKSS